MWSSLRSSFASGKPAHLVAGYDETVAETKILKDLCAKNFFYLWSKRLVGSCAGLGGGTGWLGGSTGRIGRKWILGLIISNEHSGPM